MVNWKKQAKDTLTFNCDNTIRQKANTCKPPIDRDYGTQGPRCILVMNKARKVCINDG